LILGTVTGDSQQSDLGATIAFGPEAEGLEQALAAICELELAVDIELRDGSAIEGVLVEVVSGHLALRGWDAAAASFTTELRLVPVADIVGVKVT
jgi:hypothetical protein